MVNEFDGIFFFLLIREANNFCNFKLKCFYRELR